MAHNLIDLLNKAPVEEISSLSVTAIDTLLEDAALQALNLGNNRLQAYALGNRGHLAEIQANLPPAEAYTEQAISLVSNFNSPNISYQYFWQLGRIENAEGQLKEVRKIGKTLAHS